MTTDRESAFDKLEKLIEQYFDRHPMAAENLLIHIAKFPNTFQLINYNYIAKTSLELEDAQQIVYTRLLEQLRKQKFYEGNANRFILWARFVAANTVKDFLKGSRETNISSDWSLLRKLSQKRLEESLQNAGLSTERIEKYVLAWKCFKIMYVSELSLSTRRLRLVEPSLETWRKIANLYNQEIMKQVSQPGEIVNPESIEKWLLICVKAVRSYLYPDITSINKPQTGYDSGEITDSLVAKIEDSLLNEMISEEKIEKRNQQKSQINQILVSTLEKLKPDEQKLLQLYYGQKLKQGEIAQKLDTQQYNISRKLSRIRKLLLKSLSFSIKDTLDISLSSDALKEMSAIIEEWLSERFNL